MEINLMVNYPKSIRDVAARGQEKSEQDRLMARKFDKEFFDGSRSTGYGGFQYDARFWEPVVPTFQKHWNLTKNSSILDVGCAKGFMLYDFQRLIPGIKVSGLDISSYAIENSMPEVRDSLSVGNATELPYLDKSFDYVISITTVHNLDHDDLIRSLKEITRVSRIGSFITVDAYHNEEERKRMHDWNLTAKTILHVNEWKDLFSQAGYTGEYYWFTP